MLALKFLLILIVTGQIYTEQAAQLPPSSCLFISCRCTKNFDGSYDIICEGDKDGASDTLFSFPRRSENFTDPLPIINTFLIKRFSFKQIPDDSFRDLSIRNLIIGENQLVIINLNSFRGIKSLGLLRVIEKHLEEIEFDSLRWISPTLNELGLWQLNFKSQYIDEFFNQLASLRNLKTISIMGYGLTEFKYQWTEMFHNISSINLASNDLRSINPNMFKLCNNLFSLDLSNNFLENITSVFVALRPIQNNLRELKLSGNMIKNLENFPKFLSLEILDLSFNKIKAVTNDAIYNLPKLTNFYLTNNEIERIEENVFKYSKNLQIMLLNNNKLNRVPVISSLTKLKIIDLVNQNGQLKDIGDFSFERLEIPMYSLSIHLDFNDIETFGNKTFCSRFYNTSEIFNLDLSMKALTTMNKCILRQLKSLMSTRVYLNVALSQQPAEKHTEICNCNFKTFANKNKIDLVGACGQLIGKCDFSVKPLIEDNCKDKAEFKC